MSNDYARQVVMYQAEFRQSLGQLIALVNGLVADRVLSDAEIRFLDGWTKAHDAIVYDWPGNIIKDRLSAVLADGVVTEQERAHLLRTFDDLVGCKPETMQSAAHVTELAFDDVPRLTFPGRGFCLTGNFVYAPREVCENACALRGGIVKNAISKKVHYLVVGSLGSSEWRFGSFGTKIKKAVELRHTGVPILIVREETWSAAL